MCRSIHAFLPQNLPEASCSVICSFVTCVTFMTTRSPSLMSCSYFGVIGFFRSSCFCSRSRLSSRVRLVDLSDSASSSLMVSVILCCCCCDRFLVLFSVKGMVSREVENCILFPSLSIMIFNCPNVYQRGSWPPCVSTPLSIQYLYGFACSRLRPLETMDSLALHVVVAEVVSPSSGICRLYRRDQSVLVVALL